MSLIFGLKPVLTVQLMEITVLLSIGCIITVDAATPTFLVPKSDGTTDPRSVSEDETIGTSILTLEGEDTDGDNLTFSIVTQQPTSPPFELESKTGLLKVPSGLDAENHQQYEFIFGVRDGSTTTNSVKYAVNIEDVNDNTPQFNTPPPNTSVRESDDVGTVILTVTATDKDFSSPNNQFTFSLSGDGFEHFEIDGTGSITVQSQLNYTNKASYNLTITVTDKATTNQLSSSAPLHVTLKTDPTFVKPDPDGSTGQVSIDENSGNGTFIYTLNAHDPDGDTLTFSILSQEPNNPMFYLESDTGDFRAPNGLDAETNRQYNFTFGVTDGTATVNSTQLTVNINDVNDNAPEFTNTSYSENVKESTTSGDEVVMVTATDADVSDAFSALTYSISVIGDVQDYSPFQIYGQTGSVILISQLTKVSYTFTVTASDPGNKMGSTTVSITVLDDVDECDSSPCLNGGTCASGINNFECACLAEWSGQTCQTDIDDCSPNPCANNGECKDGVASYTCNCSEGWTGTNCTNDIDDCSPNPCANNGECKDGVASYTCNCSEGWTGTNCTNDIDDCSPNPCANNGVCTDGVASYTCDCSTGWTGTYCKNDIDDCSPNPCANNGVCTDGVASYTCDCSTGWTGTNCTNDIDDCSPNPCANNGVCTDGVASYTCDCSTGWTGTNCTNASGNLGLIIGLAVGIPVGLAIFVCIAIFIRRRAVKTKGSKSPKHLKPDKLIKPSRQEDPSDTYTTLDHHHVINPVYSDSGFVSNSIDSSNQGINPDPTASPYTSLGHNRLSPTYSDVVYTSPNRGFNQSTWQRSYPSKTSKPPHRGFDYEHPQKFYTHNASKTQRHFIDRNSWQMAYNLKPKNPRPYPSPSHSPYNSSMHGTYRMPTSVLNGIYGNRSVHNPSLMKRTNVVNSLRRY